MNFYHAILESYNMNNCNSTVVAFKSQAVSALFVNTFHSLLESIYSKNFVIAIVAIKLAVSGG